MTRHGGHLMCMSGAMMATVGFLSTSYVTDIPLLILFYSVLTGLGVGLMYIPSIVACVPYFTKNRWSSHDPILKDMRQNNVRRTDRQLKSHVQLSLKWHCVLDGMIIHHCRSLAIGICLCGVGTGTFALAPISNMILEKYGWRNVMRQAQNQCVFFSN